MTETREHAVRLQRTFNTAPPTVWRMWATASEFAAWYGPDGATVEVVEMDVRVGGRRHFSMSMQTPDGEMQMWFVGEFREVDEPHRLVYTEAMADAEGTPGPGGETVVEVEFHEVGGATEITVTHHGVPAGSPGEAGWSMALQHLTDRLASA